MTIGELHRIAPPGFRVGLEPDVSVLWLTAEHDIATIRALRLVLVDLIALDEHDVVVDLSEATFIGSAVITELERAGKHLAARGRSLVVRAPSVHIRRTFTVCDAAGLFESHPRSTPERLA